MTDVPGPGTYTDFNTLLEEHARRQPDKIFIEIPDQRSSISFGEFEALTRRLANLLAAEGLHTGDRVSILSENGIEALAIFWGALRSGVIVNPINVEIRQTHVQHILQEVAPRLILWSRELGEEVRALGQDVAATIAFGSWNAADPAADDLFARVGEASDASVAARPERGDWSLIDYTSGTTDRPKGAIWTQEAYYAMCESTVDRLGITGTDTILDYRHFSWSSPQILSIGPSMLTGGTLVLAQKFSQTQFFGWVQNHGVTVAVGIPAVINMLLARPVAITKAELPTLRFMTSSTAPLSLDKHLEFEATYGIPIVQLAGGTETGFMCGNHPDLRKHGSIGRPTRNMRVRILDDSGAEQPPGEEGEWWSAAGRWHRPTGRVQTGSSPSRRTASGRATSLGVMRTGTSTSPDGRRTSSSRAASTSRRWRSQTACWSTRTWPRPAPSASRTTSTVRCRSGS